MNTEQKKETPSMPKSSKATRDQWLDLLCTYTPHLVAKQVAEIKSSLAIVREKENLERTRNHFLELGAYLETITKEYANLRAQMQCSVRIKDETIHIAPNSLLDTSEFSNTEYRDFLVLLNKILVGLAPWRKGPFAVFDTHIDAEWVSNKKWRRVLELYDIRSLCDNKVILDVGCNNGYYSFFMLAQKAKLILAVDPMPKYSFFFQLYRLLMPELPLFYEQWGIEQCAVLYECIDTVFCMGILYHQRNPLAMLETVRKTLKKKGILVLETICLNNDSPYCLVPSDRYQKARGYWFIPSKTVLQTWLEKSGFTVLAMDEPVKTELDEQRRTEWIRGESLQDFLDEDNQALTIEGYPAPYRIVVVAQRTH